MSKNVRIIANANNKNLKTANIITSGTTTHPTQAQGAADDRRFATVQDSGGTVKGLPTIIVPGYLGGAPDGTLTELAFIDFVNGVYRSNGSTVSLTDVLTFDDAGWGIADPNNIIPGSGLKATTGQSSFPRFSDAVQTALLTEGFTLVAEFDYAVATPGVTNDGMTFDLELYSADFNENFFSLIQGSNGTIGDGTHSDNTISALGTANARHKFAVTMLASGIAASLDGTSVHTVTPDTPATLHYIGFDAFNAGTAPDGNYLRTVTVYSPQMAADLPALSAA